MTKSIILLGSGLFLSLAVGAASSGAPDPLPRYLNCRYGMSVTPCTSDGGLCGFPVPVSVPKLGLVPLVTVPNNQKLVIMSGQLDADLDVHGKVFHLKSVGSFKFDQTTGEYYPQVANAITDPSTGSMISSGQGTLEALTNTSLTRSDKAAKGGLDVSIVTLSCFLQ